MGNRIGSGAESVVCRMDVVEILLNIGRFRFMMVDESEKPRHPISYHHVMVNIHRS